MMDAIAADTFNNREWCDYDYDKAFSMSILMWLGLGVGLFEVKCKDHVMISIFGGCHVIIIFDNLYKIIKVLFNTVDGIKVIILIYKLNQLYTQNCYNGKQRSFKQR